MTKLINPCNLFQVLDFGIDQDSITVFVKGKANAVISRKNFESFLHRHDKVITNCLEYWGDITINHLQDLYEFIVLNRFSISQMIEGFQRSIFDILEAEVAA